MKHLYTLIITLLCGSAIQAQYISSVTRPDTSVQIANDTSDISVKLAQTITGADIRKHLEVLASDAYEGRETGQEGNRKAAKYISDYYTSLGLPDIGDHGKYQKVAFSWSKWEESVIYINQKRYKHLWDYLAFPTQNNKMPVLMTDEVYFIGYGIEDANYNDYHDNLKGKTVMFFEGEPMDENGVSQITKTTSPSKWTTDVNTKLKLAYDKGVKMALIITPDIKGKLGKSRNKLLGPQLELGINTQDKVALANHCYISTTMAQAIWMEQEKAVLKARNNAQKTAKSSTIRLKTFLSMVMNKDVSTLEGENVLGYVEGTDLKDQIVVISAHFDHLGMRGDDIYNGADDNGSGTSTILDIAEAYTTAKNMGYGPRRSVLFLNVTGEEKGLLGSAYYAANPIFPLKNTVVDINVDMIGRTDAKYKHNSDYIYVIGSDRLSTELHTINEDTNNKYSQLTLDYTYNSEDDPNRYYYRSDHYNFAEKGIPAIFYFSGVHEDYHMTTDTVDKIEFEKMEKIARLIFHTSWVLANQDKRIEVDVK